MIYRKATDPVLVASGNMPWHKVEYGRGLEGQDP